MTWTLLVIVCLAKCVVMPMPAPGYGYQSERACQNAGERIAKLRGARDWICRPRMNPKGERDA